MLALSRTHRDTASRTDVTHIPSVVGPDARLLEPAHAEVGHPPAQVERLVHRVSLVCVDCDDEVVAGGRPRSGNAFCILLRTPAAALELAATEPHGAPPRNLVRNGAQVAAVIAADDVHRKSVAVPTPQLPQRAADSLADRVPDCDVDAGERDQSDPPITQLVVGDRKSELPAALV